MQTTTERRHQSSSRIAYGLPIALSHDGYHEPFEAECVDLSPGGLSLRASCLPGVGELLTCHFAAPAAGQRVEVRGEVVWAHLEGHRGGEFGVRFMDVEPTTIALISEMLGEREALLRRDSDVAEKDPDSTAKLAVDGATDTFTARLLRRDSGLVTFEQDLSFLKLGRGVSAYQGDDVQRGEIASVAVRLDGSVPKLMVTLRYADSELPDDAHTRDEAVTAPHLEKVSVKAEAKAEPTLEAKPAEIAEALRHDTVPDLSAPYSEAAAAEAVAKHAVTLTEFDAAYRTREVSESGSDLPPMSTKSEFDLPSAIEEADAVAMRAAIPMEDEDDGPALFTADEPTLARHDVSCDVDADEAEALASASQKIAALAASEAVTANELGAAEQAKAIKASPHAAPSQSVHAAIDARSTSDDTDEDDDARFEQAAARVQAATAREIGERPASMSMPDATDATVGRCDPAVMFKVDQSDEDFRLPRQPNGLTIALGVVLSLVSATRALWASLIAQLQAKALPMLKGRAESATRNFAPMMSSSWSKVTGTWSTLGSRVRSQALPMMQSSFKRAGHTLQALTQRVSAPSRRRRTTSMPITQTTAAPTVNRRSQAAAVPSKPRAQMLLLGVLAIAGVSLAGYALFSAPDPNVVPVHRDIQAAPTSAAAPSPTPETTSLSAPAVPIGQPLNAVAEPTAAELAVRAPAVSLPAVDALPAPSYEAGRIAPPSYPTIGRAAPVAEHAAPAAERAAPATTPIASVAAAVPGETVAAQEGTGAAAIESTVVTSTANQSAQRFGASSVRGRHFSLQMSAPVRGITGSADAGGFSVVIEGALSLDRAGPIAAAHAGIERAMILNKGDRAELTIRFKAGQSPKYQVIGKGDHIEITIEE